MAHCLYRETMARHECPTCGRDDFAREVDMKAHHTIAHDVSLVDTEDPSKCPLCGRVFASEAGMKAHHMLIHAESIAESRSLSQSTRQTVLDRDDYRCQRCNDAVTPIDREGPDFQLHHLIPFSAGGANHPDNLVVLCTDCHAHAHQRMKRIGEEKPDVLDELRAFVCSTE